MTLIADINTLNSWANECRILLWNLEDDMDLRAVSSYDLSQHGGIGYIVFSHRAVLQDLIEAMQWFVYGFSSSFNYSKWIDVHLGLYNNVPEITYQAIVEAWIKNDFEGRALTIGVIDRMRQILWDEPFSVVWAARPEQAGE